MRNLRTLASAIAVSAGLALSSASASAESVLRVAMTAGDIPVTIGQPVYRVLSGLRRPAGGKRDPPRSKEFGDPVGARLRFVQSLVVVIGEEGAVLALVRGTSRQKIVEQPRTRHALNGGGFGQQFVEIEDHRVVVARVDGGFQLHDQAPCA